MSITTEQLLGIGNFKLFKIPIYAQILVLEPVIAGCSLNKCYTHVAAVVRLAFNTVVSGWQINTILETGIFHGQSPRPKILK